MGWTCFDVEVTDTVGHITLNRPDKANSMIPEFWRELPEIARELDASGSVRAVVISSTGKHFCAGMDLAVFGGQLGQAGAEPGRANAKMRMTAKHLQDSFTVLEEIRMPVLAALHGGVVGGAVDMVCATDLRYATRDAFFSIAEINIGMTADVGTLQRLPRLIGEGAARELAYTGRRMTAQRAYELGLVQGLYDDHEAMLAGVLETAAEIAAKSPLAIWGSKVALNYARDHSVRDSLDHIATWQSGMFQAADMIESATAKGEGRAPSYDDLPPADWGL